MWFVWVIVIVASYLLGSIPTAYLLVKMKLGVDIRDLGSGNVGTTNSMRVAGRVTGLLVFLIDVLKGAAPVFAARLIGGEAMAACAACAAFLGHLYPLWLGFRGGKGVAISIGMAAVLTPYLALITFAVWLLLLLITHYVSIASCGSGVVLALLCLFTAQPWPYMVLYAVLCAIVLVRHRSNFRKIAAGTENKSFLFHH